MNGGSMTGQEILLSGAYPRLALAVLADEGYTTPYVLRELGLDEDILEAPMTPIVHHYHILEFARRNVSGFRVSMAERCGINTLGPLVPALLAARCAREAWLIAATYIPMLDTSATIDLEESTIGCLLVVKHLAMSDANALDFAFASAHIAASIVHAGSTSADFKITADYYNMGDFTDAPKWGDHLAKQDNRDRRVEIYIPDEVADKKWPQSTEAQLRVQLDVLEEQLARINAKPSLKMKIEKAYASMKVASGQPVKTPEQAAEYLHMSVGEVNRRLAKHDSTLKQIFLEYATRWAVLLIEDTNMSVDEVNELTYQLSSASNFTRTLKQRTGKTFTEIRGG
jgi:AraC-like DNA-binding protein